VKEMDRSKTSIHDMNSLVWQGLGRGCCKCTQTCKHGHYIISGRDVIRIVLFTVVTIHHCTDLSFEYHLSWRPRLGPARHLEASGDCCALQGPGINAQGF
jgi:hypothetical protein